MALFSIYPLFSLAFGYVRILSCLMFYQKGYFVAKYTTKQVIQHALLGRMTSDGFPRVLAKDRFSDSCSMMENPHFRAADWTACWSESICICALKRAFIKWQERVKLGSLHIVQSPQDVPYQETYRIKLRSQKTSDVRIQVPLLSRTLLFFLEKSIGTLQSIIIQY